MPTRVQSVKSFSKHKNQNVVKHYAKKNYIIGKTVQPFKPSKQNSEKNITLEGDIGSKIIIGISDDDPIFTVGELAHSVFTR